MAQIHHSYDIRWDLQRTNASLKLLKKLKVYFFTTPKVSMHAKLWWNHNHLELFTSNVKLLYTILYIFIVICTFATWHVKEMCKKRLQLFILTKLSWLSLMHFPGLCKLKQPCSTLSMTTLHKEETFQLFWHKTHLFYQRL